MNREELLRRMDLDVPEKAGIRVIIVSDIANEADDPFAVVHQLLSPSFKVCGIIAAHFEQKAEGKGCSMEQSFQSLVQLMEAAQIDDVPLLRGCALPLRSETDAPDSEGVRFMIREALRNDTAPLYVTVQGALTDVAAAINRCPEIAKRMTVVWIGGGPYPDGMAEFNLKQDVLAARAVFQMPVELWQIPLNVYSQMEVTLAEIAARVRVCGPLGRYLYKVLASCNVRDCSASSLLRKGENWCLGDQPVAGVLLQCALRGNYHTESAPTILDDMTYGSRQGERKIRVYDSVDPRMILEDFYAKLALYHTSDLS